MYHATWLLCAVFATVSAANIKPASYYFDICHLSDPNIDECLKRSVVKGAEKFKNGIPELQILSIEPMAITRIEMGDTKGSFKLHFVLKNLLIHGVSTNTLKELKFDKDKLEMSYTVKFPKMDFHGDYEMDGQILVVPIKGAGQATLNFTDVETINDIKLEEFQKGGKTYLRVKDYKLQIIPGFVKVYFSNLFNGDKQLGEATNKFMNDNWKDAFFAYKELPENAFSQTLKHILNKVYMSFPKDELFPK